MVEQARLAPQRLPSYLLAFALTYYYVQLPLLHVRAHKQKVGLDSAHVSVAQLVLGGRGKGHDPPQHGYCNVPVPHPPYAAPAPRVRGEAAALSLGSVAAVLFKMWHAAPFLSHRELTPNVLPARAGHTTAQGEIAMRALQAKTVVHML